MRTGTYCVYKKDKKEYYCTRNKEKIKLVSKNKEKLLESFLEHTGKDWRGELYFSYYKDIDLENLEDIYNINYNVVICGKEIKPRGMDKKSVTILVSDDRAMEDAVGSNIYWIIDLKSLICVEHTKPVMEDRSLKKVEVEINKIEKFVEYKKHIEIFEYKGTERREFLNTKETLDYLFDDFPN